MKVYRPAAKASFAWNYFKTMFQTLIFWSIFLFVLPAVVVHLESLYGVPEFPPLRVVGALMFSAGGVVGLWSGFTTARLGDGTPWPTDCPNRLVISGPYAFVRNPMALAGIGQGVAVGVCLGSWMVIVYALLGIPVWHIFARPSEEADMKERFGAEFEHYRRHVRLWIPCFVAYHRGVEKTGDDETPGER
ncbi:MAG: isoprenylcysteine carboxylmethyltransferase family protein [Planctomycetota bacterium]